MTSPPDAPTKGMGCIPGLLLGVGFLVAAIVLFILAADATYETSTWFVIGCLFCVLLAAGVPLWVVVRQGGEDARAMAFVSSRGPRVEAAILEVRASASAPISYRVIARGLNPLTGEETYFVGPTMRRDPRPHLGERTTIGVVVDPENTMRAVMDFSFLKGDLPIGWTLSAKELPTSFG